MFYENYRFKGHQKEPPNGPNATLQHDGVTEYSFLACQPGQVPKNVRQLALRSIWSSAQLTLAHLLYAVFFLVFVVFFAFAFVFVFAHSPLAC